MKVEPDPKALIPLSEKIPKITRIVAIIVAFISTFAFFFKILFF